MEHLSKIELIGRVGVVNTDVVSGLRYNHFSLGVDQVFNGEGESIVNTSWFSCVYWGNNEKLFKGNEIHVEGRIIGQTYSDIEGRTRTYYEVKVTKIW